MDWMPRSGRLLGMLLAGLALLCGPVCQGAGRVLHEGVSCGGVSYRYVLFVPEGKSAGEARLPAVVVLHGAGDSPDPMVAAWMPLAKQEGVVLIAPELPRVASFEALAPAVFVCMVEASKRLVRLDAQRIYLFGNSMGGYLAYDAGLLRSDYFAAMAVHAMGIDPEYAGLVKQAVRKIPVAMYCGVNDTLVPVARARATRTLLQREGFSVHYVEIEGHDHNYYALSDDVNRDAWAFMKEKHLAVDASVVGVEHGKL